MRSLCRDEVRLVDRYAIETLGVPGVVLMENAGRNAADAVHRFCDEAAARSVAIVTGSGNNAGDGFVVARHLAIRGLKVATFLVSPVEKLSADAELNFKIIRSLGLDVRDAGGDATPRLAEQLGRFDVIVDALGGTGISGALRGQLAEAVEQINAAARPVVAIDIPTGLDCDTGEAPGPAVRAALTVTMLAAKRGFDNPASRQYTGRVVVVDIGIPAELVCRMAGLDGA